MSENPYESPKNNESRVEEYVYFPSKGMWPGLWFLIAAIGTFFFIPLLDNCRAITFFTFVLPILLGTVTIVYCRRWGFLFWVIGALVQSVVTLAWWDNCSNRPLI